MWKIELPDLDATLRLGRALGQLASAGTIVALRGDLGAGKTSFAQGVGAGLNIEQAVVSPTFILMAEYEGGRLPLLHADAYRLKSGEAATIGFEETVELWPGVVLVEWAGRVDALLPADRIHVDLEHAGTGRVASISAQGPVHLAILTHWQERIES